MTSNALPVLTILGRVKAHDASELILAMEGMGIATGHRPRKRPKMVYGDMAYDTPPNRFHLVSKYIRTQIAGRSKRRAHIRRIALASDRNNTRMERLNGEVRDCQKVMSGLKKGDWPILRGYQIFHNFLCPHERLVQLPPYER